MATKPITNGLLTPQYATLEDFMGRGPSPSVQAFESQPEALKSNAVNIKNHKAAIKAHGLGPADPRQPNTAFWQDKGKTWGISEGDARGRLCANCEHFFETSDVKAWIDGGPARTFKTSMVDPALKDIESKPVAFCKLYEITCSPTRTCDSQELGGPIDDLKFQALQAQGKEID